MPKRPLLLFSFVIAALLLILYSIDPTIFGLKEAGSFEYVRRGEDLFRKGDHKRALAYFEKAFENSPESGEIQYNLIWAYSRYSTALQAAGNHDEAIRYLSRCYEIMPSRATRQNLAIALTKRAITRLRKNDWLGAVQDMTDARFAAAGSSGARKSLAISLFNDAVAEFKEGRERIALLCLKEAALSYDDSRIYELIGEIYYRMTDLERAAFYWNRARELAPADAAPALGEKLERLAKEADLARRAQKQVFPHFEIRYDTALPIDAPSVGKVLDKAYLDVGRDLGLYLPATTVVFFYSEQEFADIFKLPSAARAFYDGNIRMPFPAAGIEERELAHYLYHEYTHAVVSAITNNNCPVWLSEGIAVWEWTKENDADVRAFFAKTGLPEISIAALDGAFAQGMKKEDLYAYYLIAYTAVRYIVDTWGAGGLQDLLKRLAGGQHAVNAIDDEFLISEQEFNKRWGEYVRRRYR